MVKETPPPTRAQLQKLLDELLPPNEEMDHASALIIIERAGVDRKAFAKGLKSRLEHRIQEIHSKSEEVPPALLKVITVL